MRWGENGTIFAESEYMTEMYYAHTSSHGHPPTFNGGRCTGTSPTHLGYGNCTGTSPTIARTYSIARIQHVDTPWRDYSPTHGSHVEFFFAQEHKQREQKNIY